MKILRNSVKCKRCEAKIESKTKHGIVECECGAVTITGGKKFLVRYGKEKNFVETSLVEVEVERKVK